MMKGPGGGKGGGGDMKGPGGGDGGAPKNKGIEAGAQKQPEGAKAGQQQEQKKTPKMGMGGGDGK
jgi:hypothetical protein